jgi:hypothetical protein
MALYETNKLLKIKRSFFLAIERLIQHRGYNLSGRISSSHQIEMLSCIYEEEN